VLAGFVLVITNRRIFNEPTTAAEAWARVDEILAAPAAILLRPGRRHWDTFRKLAAQVDARGNDISDAFLAAHAVENNATWLSADRGFTRFDGLSWQHPLAS
jgi:uncharacterized protein